MRIRGCAVAGFTLVELLVVIGIVSVLIAILLPCLNVARQQAQKVVCASNLRQLALTNLLYAQDNKGFFVLAAEDIWGLNLRRWHGRRANMNMPFDPLKGPLVRYLGTGRVKECPTFSRDADYWDDAGQGQAYEAGCGGYGYNQQYIGGRNDLYGIGDQASRHSARFSDLRKAHETVMFTDCAYITTKKIAYSFCEPPFWEYGAPDGPSTDRPDPTIDFRHRGQTNVAWADGHVTSEAIIFSATYQTHSKITGAEAKRRDIGWFGPDSNELFDLK